MHIILRGEPTKTNVTQRTAQSAVSRDSDSPAGGSAGGAKKTECALTARMLEPVLHYVCVRFRTTRGAPA